VSDGIESLAAQLEETARRLRSGGVEAAEAADLVERCAALAQQLGTELDRQAAGESGQEQLL
jgi:hypothetical protein